VILQNKNKKVTAPPAETGALNYCLNKEEANAGLGTGQISHLLTPAGQQWCKKSPLCGIAVYLKKLFLYSTKP